MHPCVPLSSFFGSNRGLLQVPVLDDSGAWTSKLILQYSLALVPVPFLATYAGACSWGGGACAC